MNNFRLLFRQFIYNEAVVRQVSIINVTWEITPDLSNSKHFIHTSDASALFQLVVSYEVAQARNYGCMESFDRQSV